MRMKPGLMREELMLEEMLRRHWESKERGMPLPAHTDELSKRLQRVFLDMATVETLRILQDTCKAWQSGGSSLPSRRDLELYCQSVLHQDYMAMTDGERPFRELDLVGSHYFDPDECKFDLIDAILGFGEDQRVAGFMASTSSTPG